MLHTLRERNWDLIPPDCRSHIARDQSVNTTMKIFWQFDAKGCSFALSIEVSSYLMESRLNGSSESVLEAKESDSPLPIGSRGINECAVKF